MQPSPEWTNVRPQSTGDGSPLLGFGRRGNRSCLADTSARNSVSEIDELVTTMSHLELRKGFSGQKVQLNLLDRCLTHLHKLGKEVVKVWIDPNRGMGRYDAKLELFQKTICEKEEQRATAVAKELRNFFLTNCNLGTDTRDLALFHLHKMGQNLVHGWQQPARAIQELLKEVKAFETNVRPRLESKLYAKQQTLIIQSPIAQAQAIFLGNVDTLLRKKLFLDFDKPVSSPANRKILQQQLSDFDAIFTEIDAIGNADQLSGSKLKDLSLKFLGFRNIDRASEMGEDKLANDYALLVCAHQLCLQHFTRVEEICREIEPILFQNGVSSIEIVNEIVKDIERLANEQLTDPWTTMNSDESEVKKKWAQEVIGKIKYRYLDASKPAIMAMYRKMIVANLQRRPVKYHDETLYTSFDQLTQKLLNIFNGRLSAPIDVARAFTLLGNVHCLVAANEITADDNPCSRFDAYLRTCAACFDDSQLFLDLAKELGFHFTKRKTDLQSEYPKIYKKLFEMSEKDEATLKRKFARRGTPALFDKMIKFLKIFQNVLGQQALYFYTHNLIDARRQKFKLKRLGIKAITDQAIKKNDITVQVDGNRCTITIIRFDGITDPSASELGQDSTLLLRQQYSFTIDVEEDRIYLPTRDDLLLSIDTQRGMQDDPETNTILFDLPMIMQSLEFPSLQINGQGV